MKFWSDRVADIGLLALGIALPSGVVGYFAWADQTDEAAEVAPVGAPAGRVEVGARAKPTAEAEVARREVNSAVTAEGAPASAGPAANEPASSAANSFATAAASAAAASPPRAALAPTDPARASGTLPSDASRTTQLATRAQTLLSDDPGLRAETAHWLSHLDSDSRDAVVARLTELSDHRPGPDEVARVFALLSKSSKSDDADLALAAAALLERERSGSVLAVVEPLLYLRSLETMSGAEGQPELARFVELDDGAWEPELVRVRKRLGVSLVPALLGMRSDESPNVRRFAAAQLAALGCSEPKAVLSSHDPFVLARAIRAYASPPDYAAMPGIVRLVGDERIQVRSAARDAVAHLGRNAVWQLRELYDEVSGQPADKRWDHERTAQELYAVLDRPRVEEAETLLARGLQSLTRGDLEAMRRDFDSLLAKYPDFERRDQLAAGYAALGADLFRRDALTAALSAYRRALRLAPEASAARQWSARVAFVSAEVSLTRGVVDLTGYKRALELDPTLRDARDAIERLSGSRTRQARDMRRLAAIGALAMLLACVALLVKRRPTDRASSAAARAALPETESEPSS